jgi:predicted transcriptional regulator
MTKSVVTSARSGQTDSLSYTAVQRALANLVEKGAIKRTGDTNREGTLYRIFLPEEIESCHKRMETLQKE